MKRLVRPVLLVGLLAAASLAACSSDTEDTSSEAAAATPDTADTSSSESTVDPAEGTADAVGGPATGEPIRFGSVASLTGPVPIPGPAEIIQLWMDDYNERGGFNGRPLELVVEDAALDPGLTGAAGQKLVNDDGVVGIIGSSSTLDCGVNGALYTSEGVPWLGLGLDRSCFTSPQLFPTGPVSSVDTTAALSHLLDQGRTKLAIMGLDSPIVADNASTAEAFLAADGRGTVVSNTLLPVPPTGQAITNAVVQAKDAGADSVLIIADAQTVLGALTAASQSGFGTDTVAWMGVSGLYDEEYPALWGDVGEGFLVGINGEFRQAKDSAFIDSLTSLAATGDVKVDGFTQSAYGGALVLEEALASIDGDLTRESLTEALTGISGFSPGVTPLELDYTTPPTPESPRTFDGYAKILRVEGDEFVLVTPEWIRVPAGG
jgi:branched-chain amino acid transport system substrate-binding protein